MRFEFAAQLTVTDPEPAGPVQIRSARLINVNYPASKCLCDGLRSVAAAEFSEYVARVNSDSAFADTKCAGDLLVRSASRYQCKNLEFPRTKLRTGDSFR